MEFYLNIINDTICLLRNSTIPIGVATYSISTNLPENYKTLLPDANRISERLRNLEDYDC